MKLHAGIMEVAVANLIGYRTHIIVPNISHGLLQYEADMLCLDNSNRLTEIEIKVSLADLKADFKKKVFHNCKYVSRLIYAVPKEILTKAMEIIPAQYGIISVEIYGEKRNYSIARWERMVRHDRNCEKPPEHFIRNFCRLGCMRVWSLKEHNNKRKEVTNDAK